MPTQCQQSKNFAAMTVCRSVLQYATHILSCQSKSNEFRDAREVFFQWLYNLPKMLVHWWRETGQEIYAERNKNFRLRAKPAGQEDLYRTSIARDLLSRSLISHLIAIGSFDPYSVAWLDFPWLNEYTDYTTYTAPAGRDSEMGALWSYRGDHNLTDCGTEIQDLTWLWLLLYQTLENTQFPTRWSITIEDASWR